MKIEKIKYNLIFEKRSKITFLFDAFLNLLVQYRKSDLTINRCCKDELIKKQTQTNSNIIHLEQHAAQQRAKVFYESMSLYVKQSAIETEQG